jgi:5'-nucleotidase
MYKQVNGKYIVKSGTDFRQFSKITLNFTGKQVDVSIEEVNVNSSFQEAPSLVAVLDKYQGLY